jgi:ABC-type ATPase involved in cell division
VLIATHDAELIAQAKMPAMALENGTLKLAA